MFLRYNITVNIIAKRTFSVIFAFLLLFMTGCTRTEPEPPRVTVQSNTDDSVSRDYRMTDEAVTNPFMGFAADARGKKAPLECSLVYIDITFRELQPESPDSFDFDSVAEENNIGLWKSQGKHAVLRFVCDKPEDYEHIDIPDWLYTLTGDGSFYDTSYGKGYSPDYSNSLFIEYHKKAIKALADYFNDGFVSYVELGSLGHWGEWHVKREDGIVGMPDADIRDEYVRHYVDSFSTAKLLMRRPFSAAAEYGLGLFNDMAGEPEATGEWLDWINRGGEYTQTGEKDALAAMPDFWHTAPSGGEFTSSLTMEYLCGEGLGESIKLLQESHTTFIGPKCPLSDSKKYTDVLYQNGREEIIRSIGYRIGITHVEAGRLKDGVCSICIDWQNDGIAPLYFDLPVKLFYKRDNGSITEAADVDIKLSMLTPGESITTETEIRLENGVSLDSVMLGIIDPMTGLPGVKLVSDQTYSDGYAVLF